MIVVLPHSLDLYGAYIGALLGGLVPAMFAFPSPKFSEREYFRNIGALISTAGGSMLVTYPELAAKLEQRERAALASAQLVTPDMLPAGGTSAWRAPATVPGPEDTAFVQYSSGTTGIKKGVAVSHRALLWQIDAYAGRSGPGPADRIVSWLPLYHDMGLIACLFLPLLKRIPLVAMSPFRLGPDALAAGPMPSPSTAAPCPGCRTSPTASWPRTFTAKPSRARTCRRCAAP